MLQAQLDAHLKFHNEKWSSEEVRKCKLCNKQFTQPALYRLHVREHYRVSVIWPPQKRGGSRESKHLFNFVYRALLGRLSKYTDDASYLHRISLVTHFIRSFSAADEDCEANQERDEAQNHLQVQNMPQVFPKAEPTDEAH